MSEHKQSDFAWQQVFKADGLKTHLSVYRAAGTDITLEHLDYPHHSEHSEWRGIDIYILIQTTFHNFHEAREAELKRREDTP